MLGTVMFLSKIVMEWAPNIHLLAMLTVSYTVVYRKKALIPIYIFVFLVGLIAGFSTWWIPYLYLWLVPWGVAMLLPKNMSSKIAVPVYMAVCALHGLFYGVLYAPFQAVVFGLNLQGIIAWIIAGLPFDIMHAIGNLAAGSLTVPLINLLRRLSAQAHIE